MTFRTVDNSNMDLPSNLQLLNAKRRQWKSNV